MVANLGGQVKRFTDHYDRLPIDVRLGWSQSFGSFPVRFSVTAWNLTKWHLPYYEHGDGTESSETVRKDSFGSNLFRHLVFGADLISRPNWYLGLCYNNKTRTDMGTYSRNFHSGFSHGGSLRPAPYRSHDVYAEHKLRPEQPAQLSDNTYPALRGARAFAFP